MSHYLNPPRTCALPVTFLMFTSLSTFVFFLELHNRIYQNQDCIYTTEKGWKRSGVCSKPGDRMFNTRSKVSAIIEFQIHKAVNCRQGSALLSCLNLPSSHTGKSFRHMLPVSGVPQLKSRYVTMTSGFSSFQILNQLAQFYQTSHKLDTIWGYSNTATFNFLLQGGGGAWGGVVLKSLGY
jgi:hypothetical protein